MTINWGLFWTPEFLIGVVVIGLLLNVVAAYVVRSLDWVVKAFPARYRHVRQVESERIQRLSEAAISDHALYAALVGEASRLRSGEIRSALVGFACVAMLIALVRLEEVRAVGTRAVLFYILVTCLVVFGFVQYVVLVEYGKRARRLDAALRQVHRKLQLPIMD